jgi:hypothetical protein
MEKVLNINNTDQDIQKRLKNIYLRIASYVDYTADYFNIFLDEENACEVDGCDESEEETED